MAAGPRAQTFPLFNVSNLMNFPFKCVLFAKDSCEYFCKTYVNSVIHFDILWRFVFKCSRNLNMLYTNKKQIKSKISIKVFQCYLTQILPFYKLVKISLCLINSTRCIENMIFICHFICMFHKLSIKNLLFIQNLNT